MLADLRRLTAARVALGAAGDSLPTRPLLDLRLAHARARDAVHWPFDADALRGEFAAHGWDAAVLSSAARGREEYLRRPDLGRRLDTASRADLRTPRQVAWVVGDGLSPVAVERHAAALLDRVFALLGEAPDAPLLIVRQARVAIADEIGEAVGAEASVMLIGERPGLTSPDSLGVYLTWEPRAGRTDAERNCISNIHAGGLSYEAAAFKLVFLLREMRRLRLSGVGLKDTSAMPGYTLP
jgi:ethanolamine ammonia-lyase small subunit